MTAIQSLTGFFEDSIRANWDRPSLSDYGGVNYTYREIGEMILKYHAIFRKCGVLEGDKICLIGKNSTSWAVTYLGAITYGAVIVPILPDFKPKDFVSIINHSDSILLFIEESILQDLDTSELPGLNVVLGMPDLKVHYLKDAQKKDELEQTINQSHSVDRQDFKLIHSETDHLGVISYTSGTTGFSKGVMLQHKSLLANIEYARRNMPLVNTDEILSFLPMAHAFGCTFEFLFPFTLGCHITFLNKIPSPSTILKAFEDVKPALILTVPLTIEKIYKGRIAPSLNKPVMKALTKIPLLNRIIFRKIHEKLYKLFGGKLKELIIGGAPFNHTVEQFFRKIGFPYTVGYGMTECGPLISYASWKTTKMGAAGRVVDELEMKIDSPDPFNVPGEIMVRGTHVMLGYYKNEAATKDVKDEHGWLRTGDMATIDRFGNIFIRGRSKSMLLGPSGQNIYPEELESMLNNMPLVLESVVIQRDGKLVALLFPDADAMAQAGVNLPELPDVFAGYIHNLNHSVPKYMNVADFEIMEKEFEKTPKRNPKRFLYK